ncbi:alpha/beta hydrolase [Mycolicibacterium sp.]|uniref:alpha/beta fold hydrolase n=1 Tax=Mycolicibacterium sp. TaxID=2320850 RepID=UPI003D126395
MSTVAATEGAVDLGGIRWAYTERGGGPPVIFLHGTLTSSAMYAGVIDALCDRYRCIAVDLPGHGRSGFDPDGWTADDVVAGVTALVSAIGCGPATLVGLSQGGAVALRVALAHPGIVTAVVTQGAGPDGPAPEAVAVLTAVGCILASGAEDERRAAATELQSAFHAAGWLRRHPRQAQDELAVILAQDRRAVALATRVPGTYTSIENELGHIRCPALIMWGEEDPRAFWGPRMVTAMPAARLVTVAHAGHHMVSDAPAQCVEEIGRFLDEVHGIGAGQDPNRKDD